LGYGLGVAGALLAQLDEQLVNLLQFPGCFEQVTAPPLLGKLQLCWSSRLHNRCGRAAVLNGELKLPGLLEMVMGTIAEVWHFKRRFGANRPSSP